MRVRVRCFGSIDIQGTDPDGFVEVQDDATLAHLFRRLRVDKAIRKHCPVMVNGELVKRTYRLQEGDELVLVIPAGGG